MRIYSLLVRCKLTVILGFIAFNSFSNNPLHSLPIELFGDKILIKVYIYDTLQFTALFDPGTYIYINSGTAQKNHLQYDGFGKIAGFGGVKEINTIADLGLGFGDFVDSFHDIRSQPTAPYLNRRIDIVFGRAWIEKYVIEIDYEKPQMLLYDPNDYKAPEGFTAIKCISWNNYPLVKSYFTFDNGEKKELNVELNNGSELGFILDEHITSQMKLHKIQKNSGNVKLVGSDGRAIIGTLTKLSEVEIAGFTQEFVRGGFFEDGYGLGTGKYIHGQVGQPFLKFYNTVLDFNSGYVYLKEKAEPKDD